MRFKILEKRHNWAKKGWESGKIPLKRKLFAENVTFKGKLFNKIVLLKGKKRPELHFTGLATVRETPVGVTERRQGSPSTRGTLRSVWPTGKSKATGQVTFHSVKRS